MTVIAVFALIVLLSANQVLEIVRQADGTVIASYPLPEGATFSITFIHSVNQSPVEDVFQNRGGKLVADRTIYYEFGAGVQSELNEGDTLITGDAGELIITHAPTVYKFLNYIVGTVSDHVLKIDDQSISLRDLCGKNTAISFRLK